MSIKNSENKHQEPLDSESDFSSFYPCELGIYIPNESDPDINKILNKMKNKNESYVTKIISLFYPNKEEFEGSGMFYRQWFIDRNK